VAVAPDGTVYVTDTAGHQVVQRSPDGTQSVLTGDVTTIGPEWLADDDDVEILAGNGVSSAAKSWANAGNASRSTTMAAKHRPAGSRITFIPVRPRSIIVHPYRAYLRSYATPFRVMLESISDFPDHSILTVAPPGRVA
jgi:hypothetical protein